MKPSYRANNQTVFRVALPSDPAEAAAIREVAAFLGMEPEALALEIGRANSIIHNATKYAPVEFGSIDLMREFLADNEAHRARIRSILGQD